MATKGITYFCTDSDGNTYTRYSRGHGKPVYVTANIQRHHGQPAPSKHYVTYSAGVATNRYFTIRDGVAEVVKVRAYPGKHKVEPVHSHTAAQRAEILAASVDRR